jgi:hypothetical protein
MKTNRAATSAPTRAGRTTAVTTLLTSVFEGGSSAVKPALATALAFVFVAAAPPANAELIGRFDAGLRNIKSYGAYTVVASGRVYETTGEPAPVLATAVVHFPRGAALRKAFLVPRFFCDGSKLEVNPDPRLCARSHFATGSMVIDARPAIADAFGVSVDLFLAEGSERGAKAAVVVLVKSNEYTPFYDYEVLRGYLFKGSSAGKRFGYYLELPTHLTPIFPEVTLRLAEFHLKMRGLTLTKRVRTCVKRTLGSRGRCLKRRKRPRRIFWIKTPNCPRTAKVSFGADYAFEGASPIYKRKKVSCRRFRENPTLHRGGRIPGA